MESDQVNVKNKQKKIANNSNKALITHFKEYCRYTSIHGFKYFGDNRTLVERIWWIISISLCVIFCGVMIHRIFLKYSYYPVIVTFSMKETKLQKLPFPAITMCPRAKISQSYFNITAVAMKTLNNVPLTTEEKKNMDLSATVCEFYSSNETTNVENNEFYEFLKKSSTDIFHYCQYFMEEINCTKLFTPILTEEGICYSFNILDKKEIFRENTDIIFDDFHKSPQSNWGVEEGYTTNDIHTYPRRALRIGVKNALSLMVKVKKENIEFQCPEDESGYRISVHLPSDIPDVTENYVLVPLNTRVNGVIIPRMIKTSDGVKSFHPLKRDCYFQSEKYLKFFNKYSYENCILECKTNYTLKVCNCVGFHMPKEPETPICLLNQIQCMENALSFFSIINEDHSEDQYDLDEVKCDCKQTCTDISFDTVLSYNPIIFNLLNKTLKNAIDYEHHIYTIINFYFKNNHVETKERNEIYGFSDVISNFGGLLGLFTGFSILSFLEILYFFTLRIWGNIRIYGTIIGPNID